MGGACGMYGRERNLYRVLVGKPEGKRPPGTHRGRGEDNIKIILKGIGYKTMDWICVAQDRGSWQVLSNAVMNLYVPENVEIFLTS
jgi:hypothetical protein